MIPELKEPWDQLQKAYDELLESEVDPHGILDADDAWGELAATLDLKCDTGQPAIIQFGRWQRWVGQLERLEMSERDSDWDLATAYSPGLVVAYLATLQAIKREFNLTDTEADSLITSWITNDEMDVVL